MIFFCFFKHAQTHTARYAKNKVHTRLLGTE
jgi:hypothetical protein